MEPVEVRLARIEEGIVSVHGKLDAYHLAAAARITPLEVEQRAQGTRLTILDRDKWWLFSLAGAAFTTGLYALFGAH
jgi:hypothetical protein